jgi:hypothetical protein
MMLADQVVGAWELVSFVTEYLDHEGTEYPLGPDAAGIIMYTGGGYMSAQIMQQGRVGYDLSGPSDDLEAVAAAARGYLAYSGPYTADENTQTLHHQVEVSLLPAWLKTSQSRQATFAGDQMTLTAEDTSQGRRIRSVLVWKRATTHA